MDENTIVFILLTILVFGLCLICILCASLCKLYKTEITNQPQIYAGPGEYQSYQEESVIQPVSGQLITIQTNLENECAICLSEFDSGETVRILDCGHYYHAECVDPWLISGKKCPKCRGENMV